MKKVIMAVVLFLSVSGIALAQTTPKKDTASHSKMSKDHVKKTHKHHHKKAAA